MSDERSLEEVRAEVMGRLGLGEAPLTLEAALAALEERDLDEYVPCPFVGLDGCQGRRIPAKPTCLNCLRFHRHDFLTEAEFPLDGGLQVDQLTGEQAVLLAAVRQAAHQATIEHFVAKALIPEGQVTCPHKGEGGGCLGHKPKKQPTCDPCREMGRSAEAWAKVEAGKRKAELVGPRPGVDYTDYQVQCSGPVVGAGLDHVGDPHISRTRKVGLREARRARDKRVRALAGAVICEACAAALVVLVATTGGVVDLLTPKRCAWEGGCHHHSYHEFCAFHYGATLVAMANGQDEGAHKLRQDSYRRTRK